MEEFWHNPIIIGMLTSVLATALWQFFGYLSPRLRTPLDFVASIAGGGVVRKFRNFHACRGPLSKALASTSFVKFLAIRGFSLAHEADVLKEALSKHLGQARGLDIRVLIGDPEGSEIQLRAREYAGLSPETVETYLEQIKTSIREILDLCDVYPKLMLRLHNEPTVFRLLITEDWCFVGFYTNMITGYSSPVIMINRRGVLYAAFERLFERFWERSKAMTPSEVAAISGRFGPRKLP